MQNSARRIFSANLLRAEYTLSTQFKQDLVRVKIEIFSKKGEHRLFRIYYTSLRKKEGMTTNPKKINAKAGLSRIGQSRICKCMYSTSFFRIILLDEFLEYFPSKKTGRCRKKLPHLFLLYDSHGALSVPYLVRGRSMALQQPHQAQIIS